MLNSHKNLTKKRSERLYTTFFQNDYLNSFADLEWAAAQHHIEFLVLVDDGKIAGLYRWLQLGEWERKKNNSPYEPLTVSGYAPIIVDNKLGKTLLTLHAWYA